MIALFEENDLEVTGVFRMKKLTWIQKMLASHVLLCHGSRCFQTHWDPRECLCTTDHMKGIYVVCYFFLYVPIHEANIDNT